MTYLSPLSVWIFLMMGRRSHINSHDLTTNLLSIVKSNLERKRDRQRETERETERGGREGDEEKRGGKWKRAKSNSHRTITQDQVR